MRNMYFVSWIYTEGMCSSRNLFAVCTSFKVRSNFILVSQSNKVLANVRIPTRKKALELKVARLCHQRIIVRGVL